MRKLEIKDAEIVKIAVQEEIQRSEEAKYDHRLHGILLFSSSQNCYQVAKLLGHSPRTIQYWVKRFEKSGFAGLRDQPKLGRPKGLEPHMRDSIEHDLRQNPRDFCYSQNLWDGKLLSHHVNKKFGVKLGVRQCQNLFHEFGFRRRKPRPIIAKADPDAQNVFKKNS